MFWRPFRSQSWISSRQHIVCGQCTSFSFERGLELAAVGMCTEDSKEDFRLKHSSRRHLKRKNNTTVISFAGAISLAEIPIPSCS